MAKRDYGSAGRFGIATPQANPTVEPEVRRLFPMDIEYYTVRLTSESGDGRARVADYIECLPEYVGRFGGMQLDALLFACTGSSYLISDQRHNEIQHATETVLGAPVIFASHAIRDWLQENGYRRISLLTPYPDWLNELAVRWWQEAGFEISGSAQVELNSSDLYAIYEQQSSVVQPYVDAWQAADADAWVVSGTGMPALPIVRDVQLSGRPVMSSNLALTIAGLGLLNREPLPNADWFTSK